MLVESLDTVFPSINAVLACRNRMDEVWKDWCFNQSDNIHVIRDSKNGCLYLYLDTREIVLIFMPPGFQMKNLIYQEIVAGLLIQDCNFLTIIVGNTFDKYNYCPAEGRPICRMPFNVFVAPPAHQAITVHIDDATDNAKYIRASLCDVLVLRSLLKDIASIASTVIGDKQMFYVITEIKLLAPCMTEASHAIKQWCV